MVIFEAGLRLAGTQRHAVEATVAAFVIIAVSIVVDFFRARTLRRVAQATLSEALEADALHFSSDMWSSIAVLFGLGGVALGYSWADAAAALVVAVFICIAGWRLGWRTIETLTDTAPAGVRERITAIARRVPGVVAIEQVRARPAGAVLFVDLGVGVSRTLPLDRVSAIKDRLTREIRAELPTAELTITTEPRALDDETARERVMLIARNRGLAIHHVAVQTDLRPAVVSADLEVEGTMPLAAAHDSGKRSRRACATNSGRMSRSKPTSSRCRPTCLDGRDAPADRVTAMREGSTRRPPRLSASATCTRFGSAKPTTARSSSFIAASTRRYRSARCTIWSIRGARLAPPFPRHPPRHRPRRAAAVTFTESAPPRPRGGRRAGRRALCWQPQRIAGNLHLDAGLWDDGQELACIRALRLATKQAAALPTGSR